MPILKTKVKCGEVEGVMSSTPGVSVFKGVPFAAPPVGKLRWREPQEHEPWSGVYQCDHFGPACPQDLKSHRVKGAMGELTFNEDCLYLNIWTPAETTQDKLPVMMWIFGGGAQGGFPSNKRYNGEHLAAHGVILVTINYRVNVFGFFGHEDLIREGGHNSCGNYGILDQAFALKWLNENIQAFGGDPDNITVFGQSCGGRSTICMSCSPLTEGRINRAIVHSAAGLVLAGGKLTRDDIARNGAELMKRMGVSTLDDMRNIDAFRLREEYTRITGDYLNSDLRFNICSDGYVMPEDSRDSILNGHYHNISYMLGTNSNEGGLMAVLDGDHITKENLYTEGPKRMMDQSLAFILDMYDPKTDEEARQAFIDVLTVDMTAGMNAWADLMEEKGYASPFVYRFDRPAPGDRAGAYHGGELWYTFGTLGDDWRPFTPEDFELSQKVMRYWANFAKTGDPNGEGLAEWTRYTKESPLSMKMNLDGCGMADCEGPAVKKLKKMLLNR